MHETAVKSIRIVYISAEIGLSDSIPTFSGGLGVLAGDHIKSAADLGLPLCGVTLLYKEGYFRQSLEPDGTQVESYPSWDPSGELDKLAVTISLPLNGREVQIGVWQKIVTGRSGAQIPVYYLSTDQDGNDPQDRLITQRLYSGGEDMRIRQEAVLGIGAVRLMSKLGFDQIQIWHMNEGHTAFAATELMNRVGDVDKVRAQCVFTTHTTVPAGHDIFEMSQVREIMGDLLGPDMVRVRSNGTVNMTSLALDYSGAANGVSKLHGEVAAEMFPQHKIDHITNGVHHLTWTAPATRAVFDRVLPGWREDPHLFADAQRLDDQALKEFRTPNREAMFQEVSRRTGRYLSADRLTIGFARRAASYKRAWLIFSDLKRLSNICRNRVQFVFAGKAHPQDPAGKAIIKRIVDASRQLGEEVPVVYLTDHNMKLGLLLTSGVDVWLNTPLRPNEASGTSGMKAAMNGVLNLSTLDGWWAEAARHGENGWVIGADHESDQAEANFLFDLLESEVLPTFFDDRQRWNRMMIASIQTAADFTSERMVRQYAERYYHNLHLSIS